MLPYFSFYDQADSGKTDSEFIAKFPSEYASGRIPPAYFAYLAFSQF